MLVCIPQVLDAAQIVSLRERLDRSNSWVDGRVTAGYQGAPVKFNLQIDERSETALACQRIVTSALERHPIFISAVLPNTVYPPMFNRYGEGMTFGAMSTAASEFTRMMAASSGPTCRRRCS